MERQARDFSETGQRPAQRSRRLPAEQRAAQILEAAVAVFARRGYHKATTREIAAQAGISEGTIYIHFASKRELLFAMVSRLMSHTLLPLTERLENADVATFLCAVLDDRLHVLETNRDLVRVIFQEIISDEDLRQEYLGRVVVPLVQQLQPMWRDRLEAGLVRNLEPLVLMPAMAGATLAAILASSVSAQYGVAPVPRDKLITQLVDLFLHGIVPGERI